MKILTSLFTRDCLERYIYTDKTDIDDLLYYSSAEKLVQFSKKFFLEIG